MAKEIIAPSSSEEIISPLRYPGGKQALVPYVIRFLKANDLYSSNWIEAFAGGASITLNLLKQNTVERATLIEKDPLVYAFWKCLKHEPAILCEKIEKLEVSMKTWKNFQKYRSRDALSKYSLLELGLAGLFFNRTNYSGIIGANPIGGMSQESEYKIDCRFTKDTVISRICDAVTVSERLNVVHSDAVSYLKRSSNRIRNSGTVVYVDPPYYAQGKKLYRYHFTDRQHRRLAEFLNKAEFPWLVSYDNAPFIVNLFREQRQQAISLQYTVRQSKSVDELLISNQQRLPDAVFTAPTESLTAGEMRAAS